MVITVLIVVVGLGQPGLADVPKPAMPALSWQLAFEYEDIQRISVRLPGDERPTTYWYLLFTATNDTGKEVEFFPTFHVVTDTLGVIDGGDRISPSVFEAIKSRHKKSYPFLRNPMELCGKLLLGPDNAVSSAAIFRDFDPEANAFALYISGLSGEIVRLANPAFESAKAESAENPRFFVLRKTLAISYDLPGDRRTRQSATPIRRRSEWVMR